jgi:ATP-dependent protease ClpP protease subunit
MSAGSQWYVLISGKQYGPIELSHLERLSSRGRLKPSDLVWTAGYDSWVSVASIHGLFPQPPSDSGETASVLSAPHDGDTGEPATTAQGASQSDDAGPATKKRRNYFVRHWRSELSLPVSYWVNGFLGNVAAIAAIAIINANANLKDDFAPLVALSSGILIWGTLVGTLLWQVVGTWRSADRYKVAHPQRYWGGIAQFVLVIAVLRTVGQFAASGIPQLAELYQIYAGDDRMGQHAFRVLRDGRELEFAGGITFGSAKEFARFLDAMGALEIVHLNSVGGRILEAQRIGALIKKRNLSTYVSRQCLSACTIMFLSGRERYMSSGARLGFHQPDFAGVTTEERRAMIAGEQVRLRGLGVSEEFARKANQAKPDDMWFPTSAELIAEGVVTRIVQSSDFAVFRDTGIVDHLGTSRQDALGQ